MDKCTGCFAWSFSIRLPQKLLPLALTLPTLGLGLAVVNTMLDAVSKDLEFDKNIGGAVVTATIYLGCTIGSFLSGVFKSRLNKFAQTGIGFFFLLGSLLCGLSTKNQLCWKGAFAGCVPTMMLFGRLITGFASGLTVVISPKYLADVSIPKLRMSLCTVFEICLVIGVVIGFLLGLPYEFDSFNPEFSWWRVMFLFGTFPAVIQILLDLIVTLFPSRSLPSIVDLKEVQIASSKSVASQTPSTSQELHIDESILGHRVSLKALVKKKYRKSVILGTGIPVACQLSGINVLGSYSTIVFEGAGFSRPIIGSILFGVTNLVCTVITVFVIEHVSRRSIASFSFLGMAICFTGIALADLSHVSIRGVLSLGFVLLYVLFFSTGCGPLGTGYAPEVVPPSIAGTVLGIGQALCRLTDLILVVTFPELLHQLGALPAFLVFAFFAFASYFFIKYFMIETKGRALSDIFQEVTAEPAG